MLIKTIGQLELDTHKEKMRPRNINGVFYSGTTMTQAALSEDTVLVDRYKNGAILQFE